MRQLYRQLPDEFIAFQEKLSLARKAWQLFGLSYGEICEMDDCDLAMLEIALDG